MKFCVFVYVIQDRVNVWLGKVWVTACIGVYINWSHCDAGFESWWLQYPELFLSFGRMASTSIAELNRAFDALSSLSVNSGLDSLPQTQVVKLWSVMLIFAPSELVFSLTWRILRNVLIWKLKWTRNSNRMVCFGCCLIWLCRNYFMIKRTFLSEFLFRFICILWRLIS